MGRNTDRTFLQIRMLNTGKGPAVQALRAQCDKQAYRLSMKYALELQPRLELKQATVVRLVSESGPDGRPREAGVETSTGAVTCARGGAVLTPGPFTTGRHVAGERTTAVGRA